MQSNAKLEVGTRLINKYSGNVVRITGECARGYEATVIALGEEKTYKEKDLVIGRSWWNFYEVKK